MELSIELIIAILAMAGSIVGVWTSLNSKITKLETKQEEHDKQGHDIKDIKVTMQTMMVSMAKIETYIELQRTTP